MYFAAHFPAAPFMKDSITESLGPSLIEGHWVQYRTTWPSQVFASIESLSPVKSVGLVSLMEGVDMEEKLCGRAACLSSASIFSACNRSFISRSSLIVDSASFLVANASRTLWKLFACSASALFTQATSPSADCGIGGEVGSDIVPVVFWNPIY
jgi:hypothetical protein